MVTRGASDQTVFRDSFKRSKLETTFFYSVYYIHLSLNRNRNVCLTMNIKDI